MNRHRFLAKALAGLFGLLAFLGVVRFTAATPPSGISFFPVGRATLPEFAIDRENEARDWRIELKAPQAIDVATQIVIFQPGGYSGWHTHPGPVFFTVITGTLTVYEGEDRFCTPHLFAPGTGAVEAGIGTHVHMVRNETASVAQALVTYMVPVGTLQQDLRSDRPDPGNCLF